MKRAMIAATTSPNPSLKAGYRGDHMVSARLPLILRFRAASSESRERPGLRHHIPVRRMSAICHAKSVCSTDLVPGSIRAVYRSDEDHGQHYAIMVSTTANRKASGR